MNEFYFGVIRAGPIVTDQGVFIQVELTDSRIVLVRSSPARASMDYIFLREGKNIMFYGKPGYLIGSWKRAPDQPNSYEAQVRCYVQAERIRTLENYST